MKSHHLPTITRDHIPAPVWNFDTASVIPHPFVHDPAGRDLCQQVIYGSVCSGDACRCCRSASEHAVEVANAET